MREIGKLRKRGCFLPSNDNRLAESKEKKKKKFALTSQQAWSGVPLGDFFFFFFFTKKISGVLVVTLK